MGLQLLGDATSGLDDLDHYYQALSEGDRSKLLELLGPGVLDADSARRDATSADMSLMPRGAGSAERRLQLLDTGVTNRENALLGARSAARSARGDIATARGSLGSSVLSGSSSTGLGLLGEILNRKTVGFDQERAAGQALWQIMQLFGPSGGAKTTERGTIPRGSNISQFMGSTPGVKPTSTMSPYGPYN
jgi:hypothetical protein